MFYVVFAFIVDSTLLRLDGDRQTIAIYNVLSLFTLVEFSLFTYVLYTVIDNPVFKRIIQVSAAAFYIFAIILYILDMRVEMKSFDSLSASVEAILVVTYSIFYLFDQMSKPQVFFIYQEPNFWFVVGFILYFSGTLFLFIQASNLQPEIRQNFWKINYFLNITKNILFAIAFSTKKSRTLTESHDNPFDRDIFENPYKT